MDLKTLVSPITIWNGKCQIEFFIASIEFIDRFDMAFFPKSLRVINMQKNMIEDIGNYYKMFDKFSLLALDLSYNKISYLEQQIFVVSWSNRYTLCEYLHKTWILLNLI